MGEEADKGKLKLVWRYNDRVLPLTRCSEYPQEDFGSELGGGYQWRGEGYLQGVIPPSLDAGGLSGRGVPIEGPHNRKSPGTIHV